MGGEMPGDAELATDVMRFFAILAICIIALSSLVDGLHGTAVSDAAEPAPAKGDRPRSPEPEPAVGDPSSPAAPAARHQVPRVVADTPAPPPVAPREAAARSTTSTETPSTTEPAPAFDAASAPAASGGPALRFASAEAMLRLVSGNQVRIYALTDVGTFRLASSGTRFVSARPPQTLYLITPGTVPRDLEGALARAAVNAGTIRWGVDLSAGISRRLASALSQGASGLLLIDAAGRIRPAGSGS